MDYPRTVENPMPTIQIATAGEALIDLIAQTDGRYKPCLGGAVFNLTRAVARQGVGVVYLNPLSHDRFGRMLASALMEDGVALARPAPVAESTSLAVVGLDETGHPDYAFYRQGVADRVITAEQFNASVRPSAGAQHRVHRRARAGPTRCGTLPAMAAGAACREEGDRGRCQPPPVCDARQGGLSAPCSCRDADCARGEGQRRRPSTS